MRIRDVFLITLVAVIVLTGCAQAIYHKKDFASVSPIKTAFVACDRADQVESILDAYKESGSNAALSVMNSFWSIRNIRGEHTCVAMRTKIVPRKKHSHHLFKDLNTGHKVQAYIIEFTIPGEKAWYYGLFSKSLMDKIEKQNTIKKLKNYI